jgi:hypothetical protein
MMATRVARSLLRTYLPVMLVFVAIALIVSAGVFTIAITAGDTSYDSWVTAGAAPGWWFFVIGTLLPTVHLRLIVAAGVTRRDFLRGAALAALVTVPAFALVSVAGYILKELVLSGSERPDLAGGLGAGEVLTVFAGTLVMFAGFAVSGTLIGAGFYRYGGWPGLAVMLPAFLPAAVGFLPLGLEPIVDVPLLLTLGGSIVATAAGAAALWAVVTGTPIRQVTA